MGMASKLRIQCPGEVYQAMNRGNQWEAMFADDVDSQRL